MEGDSKISGQVIRSALEVHRALGPGLLESAYRVCLVHELRLQGLGVEAEVSVPLWYRGVRLDCGYKLDLVVEGELIVELKAVQMLSAVHVAQVLTYLKLARKRVGLLVNFNVVLLRDGLRRVVLDGSSGGE